MGLSISSSDVVGGKSSGLVYVGGLVLRHFGPPAVLAALIVLCAEFAYRAAPLHSRSDPDELAVSTQLERSLHVQDADILVIGDSSSGANVDARELGRLLGGKRVECLSVQGWVGPAGYAHMISTYSAKTRPPPVVLLLLHGNPLQMTAQEFESFGTEQRATKGVPRSLRRPGAGARIKLFEDFINPLADLPLPGLLGAQYGWPSDFSEAIRRERGCLPDPNQLDAHGPPTYQFQISPAVEERLETLRSALVAAKPSSVFFGVSPIPASRVGDRTIESRTRVMNVIRDALRLDGNAVLNTPAHLPDDQFASVTHLNSDGRVEYTRTLANLLGER